MLPLASIVPKPVSGMRTTARVGRVGDDQRSLAQQRCQSTGGGGVLSCSFFTCYLLWCKLAFALKRIHSGVP